jgi:hypothetical protein
MRGFIYDGIGAETLLFPRAFCSADRDSDASEYVSNILSSGDRRTLLVV